MNTETSVSTDVAAPAAPVETQPVPKNDVEAARIEVEAATKAETVKPDAEKEERQRNRTGQYIDRLKTELRDLREQQRTWQTSQQPASKVEASAEGKPTLESCNYDMEEYAEKLADWKYDQRSKASAEETKRTDEFKSQQQILDTYEAKRLTFLDEHPDFEEVVGTVDPKYLTTELQMAILQHDNGPALAYHLASNEDDLFDIASRRPELYADALNRLNKRLTAAPSPQQPTEPPPPPEPPAIARAPAKAVSKAPAPTPTVAGRSPTVVDESKLTDDEWFKRQQDLRRKR